MQDDDLPVYVIDLRVKMRALPRRPGVAPPIHGLRRFLKRMGRYYGMKCLSVREKRARANMRAG